MPVGLTDAARRIASPEMQARFQTRLAELGGLVLAIAGISLAIALATYSPADPSFDTAGTGPVRNIAGAPGADVADLLLQWFGLAGFVPAACMLAWAWRIAAHRGLGSMTLRLAALFASLPAAAAVFAALPPLAGLLAGWPSAAGPGGAAGETIAAGAVSAGRGLAGPLGGWLVWGAGLVFAALLLTLAFGLSAREWGRVARLPMLPFRGLRRAGGEWETASRSTAVGLPARARAAFSGSIEIPGALGAPGTDMAASARALLARGGTAPEHATRLPIGRSAMPDAEPRKRRGRAARRTEPAPSGPTPSGPTIALPGPGSPSVRPAEPVTAADPRPSLFGGAIAPVRRLLGRAGPEAEPAAAPRGEPAPDRGRRPADAGRTPPADFRPAPAPGWRLPPVDLLKQPPSRAAFGPAPEVLEANARLLETVLADYGVQGQIRDIRTGPVVSLYELEPAPGIRSARVIGLADDIARSLSVTAVRIATVPGRNVIGIELPNSRRETVFLSELLGSAEFTSHPSRLVLALGKDIGGNPVLADLARMPHLLIAGTTGSGKSVGVNAMIASLLYRLSPDECRLIMIDPKMLELSIYDGIPHLMAPVVTDPKKAVVALKWTVREMERRYRAMSQLGVRNVAGYNERVAEARARGEDIARRVQTGFDSETGKPTFEEQRLDLRPLPFLVVVIDEMADLMMVAGKEIESAVQRLAQMARAAGIHVIMATQRPSVDVITGTIKANFPTRISFQVISKFDSRTILGEGGSEQLLGQGDMLYMQGGGRITRVHGPFVADTEVEEIVAFLKEQGVPDYLDEVTEGDDETGMGSGAAQGNLLDETSLFDQAVALVAREGKASTSFIQRHLSIGYNRAAKLIEQMEKEGIVGAANHVGKREILVRRTVEDVE